ncbi:MAG: hypothetical protein WD276_09330 [Actinomycetota bacterium]
MAVLATACSGSTTSRSPAASPVSPSRLTATESPVATPPLSEARLEGTFLGPGGLYKFKPKCPEGSCDVVTKIVRDRVTLNFNDRSYRGQTTDKRQIPHTTAVSILTASYTIRPVLAEMIDGEWRVTSAFAIRLGRSRVPAVVVHGFRVETPGHRDKSAGRIVLQIGGLP